MMSFADRTFSAALLGLRVATLGALRGAPFCQIVFPDPGPGHVHWDPTGAGASSAVWTEFTIQLREQRAYVADTPVYAYLRWHPVRGAEPAVGVSVGAGLDDTVESVLARGRRRPRQVRSPVA
jgi:hypothetical protein